MRSEKLRIALVISHPVQHFCPQYVSFANNSNIVFKVFFGSTLGYKKYHDPGFGKEISWGNLALDKFDHEFLNGEESLPANSRLDAPSLDHALEVFKPTMLISYGYYQPLQRRAKKWANKNRVAIAYISDSEKRQHRNPLKEVLKYPIVRRYFSKINYFLSVGDANEAFYRHYGVTKDQLVRMHFPIDVNLYRSCFEKKEALRESKRARFQIGNNEFVAIVVGKLVSWKNQDHLVDALLKLEGENIFMHLFMIGSGDQMAVLKQKAEKLKKSKVHFPGFVNIEELPSYYAASDLYVHPAAIEPHSIAISEAIYMGCPIIVSNRSGSYGTTDDVQVNKNGMVYDFGNITALGASIKWMIDHAAERKQMGFYSHSLAVQFQQQAHIGIISDLINL